MKSTIKKAFAILLVVVLILSVTACGATQNGTDSEKRAQTANSTGSDETIVAANDNIASDVYNENNIVMYGFQDLEKLYNFQIDKRAMTGMFYLVYANDSDYMYEYSFNLPSNRSNSNNFESRSFWVHLADSCFANSTSWNKRYIPDLVQVVYESNVVDETAKTIEVPNDPVRGTAEITYFTNYLKSQFGNPYLDTFLSSSTISGVNLRQNSALQYYVYKEKTYLLAVTLTVAGFITSVMGFASTPGLVAGLSLIASGASVFLMGQSVETYRLRANWFRYVTVNNGTYPYSMADYFAFYNGYYYTGSGGRHIDLDSLDTYYNPSSTYYLSSSSQFNEAYKEYLRLGWMG